MVTAGATCCRCVTSAGTYREDVFQRDLILLQALLLGPRLRPRQGQRAQVRAVRRQALAVHHHHRSTKASRTDSARSTSTAICCEDTEKILERAAGQARRHLQPLQAEPGHPGADRGLQGPRLRLRQHHPATPVDEKQPHRRCHLRDPEGQRGLTSSGSTSAATARPATRSSGASCASSRASPTAQSKLDCRSAGSTRSASSRRVDLSTTRR